MTHSRLEKLGSRPDTRHRCSSRTGKWRVGRKQGCLPSKAWQQGRSPSRARIMQEQEQELKPPQSKSYKDRKSKDSNHPVAALRMCRLLWSNADGDQRRMRASCSSATCRLTWVQEVDVLDGPHVAIHLWLYNRLIQSMQSQIVSEERDQAIWHHNKHASSSWFFSCWSWWISRTVCACPGQATLPCAWSRAETAPGYPCPLPAAPAPCLPNFSTQHPKAKRSLIYHTLTNVYMLANGLPGTYPSGSLELP